MLPFTPEFPKAPTDDAQARMANNPSSPASEVTTPSSDPSHPQTVSAGLSQFAGDVAEIGEPASAQMGVSSVVGAATTWSPLLPPLPNPAVGQAPMDPWPQRKRPSLQVADLPLVLSPGRTAKGLGSSPAPRHRQATPAKQNRHTRPILALHPVGATRCPLLPQPSQSNPLASKEENVIPMIIPQGLGYEDGSADKDETISPD